MCRLIGAFETISTSLTAQDSFKTVHFVEQNVDFLAKEVNGNTHADRSVIISD